MSGNEGDEAAQRLLRSLCNADGSLAGEDDSTGGDGDEVAEQQAAAPQATKGLDWNRYRETFPDTTPRAASTAMFAEYAMLVGRISRHLGPAAVTSMTLTEAAAIDEKAREFILWYVTPIPGERRRTKIYCLLCHLLDAVRYGTCSNGSTSTNESLHKEDKKHYMRTNKLLDYTRQLVRHAQGTRAALRRNSKALELLRDERGDAAGSLNKRPCAARSQIVAHLPHLLIKDLETSPGLAGLRNLLHVAPAARLAIPAHVFVSARLVHGPSQRQLLYSSASYHVNAWNDFIAFCQDSAPADAPESYGQVRVRWRRPDGDDFAVVAAMKRVVSSEECLLTARGCTSLR